MQFSDNIPLWLERRKTLTGRTVGFVPTMGALHHGHASLIQRCRNENDVVVVSLFVNPTQFNDPRDFDRYPRTREQDLLLLRSLNVDEILAPSEAELYANGYRFRIENSESTQLMEGLRRPGFLPGVMTIVLKLLNLVKPDRAYFGEKDYQQLQLIREMVKEFFIPVEIIACPTVREESALALSSRNALLTPDARDRASLIFRALSASNCADATAMLESAGFAVDYVEEHFGRRFVAAWLDGVRLIDNVPIQ